MDYDEQLVFIFNESYTGINPVQFGYQNCAPRHSFGPVVRNFWLLHYVSSGTGFFEREGKRYTVSPGEIFVIPPHVETYYEADAENPWHYIWIGFEDNGNLPPVFGEPVLRIPGAGDIFNKMRKCQELENNQSAFLNSQIWALISAALGTRRKEADYVETALNYIETSYMQDINVEKIAAQLNLARSYFTTVFRRRIGIAPGQYLMNLRLEKAAELMAVQGKTPSVAAASVGYPDLYHFSKAFKKKYGVSPRKYRSMASNAEAEPDKINQNGY